MFDCHVHRIPIIDRIHVCPPFSPHLQEGNLIGVVNYLNILHYLVDFYSDPLSNYNFSIRELNVGSYDQVWDVREDAPLYEGFFEPEFSRLVLRIMESHVISSVPVIDADRSVGWVDSLPGNLIGIFQRTDLIKLDFRDMSIFNCPISTFISSVPLCAPV